VDVPAGSAVARLVGRLRVWVRLLVPPRCAVAACPQRADRGHTHCLRHIIEIRQRLGVRACDEGGARCVQPRFGHSSVCRQHFELEAFDTTTDRHDSGQLEVSRTRRAAPARHLRAVPGLEISYEDYTDPGGGDDYRSAASGAVDHGPADPGRRRVYMTAYVDGRVVGGLSALRGHQWHCDDPTSRRVRRRRPARRDRQRPV
jgi:hypothetical protein